MSATNVLPSITPTPSPNGIPELKPMFDVFGSMNTTQAINSNDFWTILVWFVNQLSPSVKTIFIISFIAACLLVGFSGFIAVRGLLRSLFDWGNGNESDADSKSENDSDEDNSPSHEEQMRRLRLFSEFTNELIRQNTRMNDIRIKAFESSMTYVEGEVDLIRHDIEARVQRLISDRLKISYDEAFRRHSLTLFRHISKAARQDILKMVRVILKKDVVYNEGEDNFIDRRVDLLIQAYLDTFADVQNIGGDITCGDIRSIVESMKHDFIKRMKNIIDKHEMNEKSCYDDRLELQKILDKKREDVEAVLKESK